MSNKSYWYFFRYLYEFLYGWLISALSRADSFLIENDIFNEIQSKNKGNKKKPKNKKKARPYNRDILYLQALQNMAGGYYKVNKECADWILSIYWLFLTT